MDFGDIKAAIARLQSLAEGWENAGVTELERDIALEELRRIYSKIRFGGADAVNGKADEPAATVVPPVVTEESVQEESAAIEEESEEPEIEVELIMSDDEDEPEDEALPQESTAEPTEETETASETEEETVPETEAEQTFYEADMCVDEVVGETVATTYDTAENHAESHAENHAESHAENHVESHAENHTESRKPEQSLFGDDEVVLPRSSRRRVLMSLYDDEMPTVIAERAEERKPEPKTNPAPEINSEPASETAAAAEKPAEIGEPKNPETKYGDASGDEMPEPVVMPAIDDEMVLGDVLRADVHTLGESIARAKDISEAAPVASLRAAIGINDRFLLIRDLFGGDAAAYEKAIVAIDSFDNLDDCMVHIVENYSWRSTSDGAKLIMNMIQRKFRK